MQPKGKDPKNTDSEISRLGLLVQQYLLDQMKKGVMEGPCIAHGSLEKCIEVFGKKKRKKKKKGHLEDLGTDFFMKMHF